MVSNRCLVWEVRDFELGKPGSWQLPRNAGDFLLRESTPKKMPETFVISPDWQNGCFGGFFGVIFFDGGG